MTRAALRTRTRPRPAPPRPRLAVALALASATALAAAQTTALPTEPLPSPPDTPAPTALSIGGLTPAPASPFPTPPPAPPAPIPCSLGRLHPACPAATSPPSLQYCALPPGTCVPPAEGWDGTCAPVPGAGACGATAVTVRVCGCDGLTYDSACLAAAAGTSVRGTGGCATGAPTGAPSAGPAPTRGPTAEPTDAPTPGPTLRPTAPPTKFPTRAPTRTPTLAPTLAPTTESPTATPTARPSRAPVERPTTESPSVGPTRRPTSNPTQRPTETPTEVPTEVPTAAPSQAPTRKPTRSPTGFPTAVPTDSPSTSPTPRPSRAPVVGTAGPTRSPTLPPSLSPSTKIPTELPTRLPSQSPVATAPPTRAPVPTGTTAPTAALRGPTRTAGLTVTLSGIAGLESARRWERTTAQFYERVYDDSPGVAVDEVEVAITRVTTLAARRGRRRAARRGAGGRGLETDAAVEVTYTQTTSYRSLEPGLTIEDIVRIPLSTDLRQDEYVNELKGLEGYEQLTAVSGITVASDGGDGDRVLDPDDGDAGGGLPLGAIIGGACGGLALLILAAGFLYARSKRKDDDGYAPAGAAPAGAAPDARASHSGGRTGGTGSTAASLPTYGDGSVATVDYDYSRAYGGAGDHSLSEAGGTLGSRTRLTAADDAAPAVALPPARPGSGNTLFSDDPTFSRAYEDVREELLDVYAPAGKLGVVIDTPDDGAPVVHAVKDTSPVADRVRVGDKLVAVDDEDVRAMTAIKVSKLISRKSSNASRKLTLIRHVPVGG